MNFTKKNTTEMMRRTNMMPHTNSNMVMLNDKGPKYIINISSGYMVGWRLLRVDVQFQNASKDLRALKSRY